MPRPQRCRRICQEPVFTGFSPDEAGNSKDVILTCDEFEVIRLVDLEKQTHEQCAKQMEISRTTVTEIYESAREKIADSMVNGCHLMIEGGNYRVCDGGSVWCRKKTCRKQQWKEQPGERQTEQETKQQSLWCTGILKGENRMRIAVTYENGEIFQHFGHTEQFKFYDVEDGNIISSHIVSTNGSGHGMLAGMLEENKVDVLICGGIGGGAQIALSEMGIQFYGGTSGSADEAVKAFMAGTLTFNPDVHCAHHDHEHGGEGHTCGEHGCGKGSCH